MRPTFRLLARYLEPGTPTGLTGLWTHSTPRSSLLYLYGATLEKLQSIPESSLYRQSVEAVTKHRMGLVEQTVPPGYEEWAAKAKALLKSKPEQFKITSGLVDGSGVRTVKMGNRVFVIGSRHEQADIRKEEWDGEPIGVIDLQAMDSETVEQMRSLGHFSKEGEKHVANADGTYHIEGGTGSVARTEEEQVEWENEPQLTADQVKDLETKLGAGLIEEVIQVAEGELNLVESMKQSQVWEDLEDKPVNGQWEYFERKSM